MKWIFICILFGMNISQIFINKDLNYRIDYLQRDNKQLCENVNFIGRRIDWVNEDLRTNGIHS